MRIGSSVRFVAVSLTAGIALAACSDGGTSEAEKPATQETSVSRLGKADNAVASSAPVKVGHRVAPTDGLPPVSLGHADDHEINENEVKQPHKIIPLAEKTISSLDDRYTESNHPYPADPALVVAGPGSVIHNEAGLADGSDVHIDGIQVVGKSYIIIRKNFLDLIVGPGQFAGIFAQWFTGNVDKDYENISITENVIAGANFTIVLEDGKNSTGRPKNITVHDNIFIDHWRYGVIRTQDSVKVAVTGNYGKLAKGTAKVTLETLEADAK